MDTQQLEFFRQRLLEEKQGLEQEEQDAKDTVKPVQLDQQSTGRLTRMDALQAQEMALATKRRRQLHLKEINQAILRLDSEDYGYCLECGDDIAIRRLEYNPATTHCLLCAEKLEKNG